MPRLSIILPVLDEAAGIEAALRALAPLRKSGVEIVVADGGSRDGTLALATGLADVALTAPRGRAAQMNAGAAAAKGDVLLFLHADTRLRPGADRLVCDCLERSGRVWGHFDVRIEGSHWMFPVIAFAMNRRSRLTGIVTGDRAMFVTRSAFEDAGGFPDIALMEDIAFSKRLRRRSRPICLPERVVTSGRRWEKNGVWRTMLLMWITRLRYWLGGNPADLARRYGYVPREP